MGISKMHQATGLTKLFKTRGTYGPRRSFFLFDGTYEVRKNVVFLTPSPLSPSHSRNLSVLSSAFGVSTLLPPPSADHIVT